LIGGVADGIKSRAHNSRKPISIKKIDKHLAYIEAKTKEYLELK
jgi:hypothetical protein